MTQMVVFNLANECYALEISAVQEIIQWSPVTRIPLAEHIIEGLINLRGNVIPIVDLRKRFGVQFTEAGRDSRVIVVEISQLKVGLVVDGVSEVLRIPEQQIESAALLSNTETEFIKGVIKTDKRLIILLDAAKLFSISEQDALATSLSDAVISTDSE